MTVDGRGREAGRFMTGAVRQRAAGSREADAVGVARGNAEDPLPTAPNEEWHPSLDRSGIGRLAIELVVRALEVDCLAIEQSPQDHYRFFETRHPDRRRVELEPNPFVLGEAMTGTQAELQPAVGQQINGRRIASEKSGMPEVVVEDHDPDPQCRVLGDRHQWGELRPALQQVINGGDHREAQVLGPLRCLDERSARLGLEDLEAEPERLHTTTRPCSWN